LVSIVREDITPGYQLVQSAHAIADFIFEHKTSAKQWKFDSNSIITLSIPTEQSLQELYEKLLSVTPYVTAFREPDIDNQLTAIAVYGTPDIRKMVSHLPLALKKFSQKSIAA
jgi:peptidyl-tRNA hydrolase